MSSHGDALALIDELRRRGAVEVTVPTVTCGEVTSISAKWTAPLAPHAAPLASPPEAPPIPHTDAPDCHCPACETAFGSAD